MGVGDRLREARKARNWSQSDLADKLGISLNSIANYERGVSFPKEDYLYKIMNLLQLEPNYLFQDSIDREIWEEERQILNIYRLLDRKRRRFVEYVITHESESEIEEELITKSAVYRYLCLELNDGTNGRLRLPNDSEKKKKVKRLPNADLLVLIRGSAEPSLYDGDYISVKYTSDINYLGWGLFNLDGHACIAIKKKDGLYTIFGKLVDQDRLFKKPVLYGKIIGIHRVSRLHHKV